MFRKIMKLLELLARRRRAKAKVQTSTEYWQERAAQDKAQTTPVIYIK